MLCRKCSESRECFSDRKDVSIIELENVKAT